MADSEAQKISDQLVRLVQVVFALVLAQSLFLFRNVVVHPFADGNRVAALAIAAVFITTVMSWVDWHITMVFSPYETRHRSESVRLLADLCIVVTYAYLLFTIEPLVGHPELSLRRHLLGYPLIFVGYVASGVTRRRRYGVGASRLQPIVVFLAVYVTVWFAYSKAWLSRDTANPARIVTVNWETLGFVIFVMVMYRLYRGWYRDEQKKQKSEVVVGVDVDGVLADQISGVLPRIYDRHNIRLSYSDITDWRFPIASTDIAKEIELAHQSEKYVVGMPPHRGAWRLLHFLYTHSRVMIVTARSSASRDWTKLWLNNHWLEYDDVETSAEARKSEHGTLVLIDDYLGNIIEFLNNTRGVAILVDQPWNRDRGELQPFVVAGRAFIVTRLIDIRSIWPSVVAQLRSVDQPQMQARA